MTHPKALIALFFKDPVPLWRFFQPPGELSPDFYPGLSLAHPHRGEVPHALLEALTPQDYVEARYFKTYPTFPGGFPTSSRGSPPPAHWPSHLYLWEWTPPILPKDVASWPTLPDLLRRMPKDKSRLPYLKTIQFLCGVQDCWIIPQASDQG